MGAENLWTWQNIWETELAVRNEYLRDKNGSPNIDVDSEKSREAKKSRFCFISDFH